MAITTENLYTGDGTSVLFSFTFPYIAVTDVYVSVDGTDLTLTTEYQFSNATTIEILSAPAVGSAVRVYRKTDSSDVKALFFPGSAIRARDLNDNFTQNLYVTQESVQTATEATTSAAEAAASAALAVSSAAQASSDATQASADAATAQASAAAAASDIASAQADAASAQASASAAQVSALAAQDEATQASIDSATAVSVAGAVDAKADQAISTADGAEATANAIDGKATTALSTSQDAETKADAAVVTANAADSKADAAVVTANDAAATVASGPVVSVNSQTGVVSLGLDDLSDVQTAGTGHVPTDGQALVWRADHGHWMPMDVALDINSLPTLP